MKTKTTVAAICVCVAIGLIVQGCGPRETEGTPVTIEELKPIIDAAFKSYLEDSRKKALDTIVARAEELASQEIERLNEAERTYNEDVLQTIILPGPMAYGWYLKQYRVYNSALPADIVEDKSMVIAANIYIKYNYDLYETKRYHNTFEEDPAVNARLETEFLKTDKTGFIVLSYGFDNDYEYNGLPPAVIYRETGTNEVGSGMTAIGEGVEYGAHWVSWSSVRGR